MKTLKDATDQEILGRTRTAQESKQCSETS